MTFKDAVAFGLGLDVDDDHVVTAPQTAQPMCCPDCGAKYVADHWNDVASCKCCYSSNVRIVDAHARDDRGSVGR